MEFENYVSLLLGDEEEMKSKRNWSKTTVQS